MEKSVKIGLCFGLTSAIITTLGIIVGLDATIASKLVVIGGILTVAIADALSDSLGIHVTMESNDHETQRSIWRATGATFLAKFTFGMLFIVPVLLFDLAIAVVMDIIWGLLALSTLSYYIAKNRGVKAWGVIAEHLTIAVLVILVSKGVGMLVNHFFV